MTQNPELRPVGTTFPPVTPDPPPPPGSDLAEIVDRMSEDALSGAEESEPQPDAEAAAPEGDAQHEPAD